MSNIFDDMPVLLKEEEFKEIIAEKAIKIERIVSKGHSSPPGFWYDQQENEWVLLLKGEAKILFENGGEVHLKEGDYLYLPAHKKHRVEWTAPDTETVWLAVWW